MSSAEGFRSRAKISLYAGHGKICDGKILQKTAHKVYSLVKVIMGELNDKVQAGHSMYNEFFIGITGHKNNMHFRGDRKEIEFFNGNTRHKKIAKLITRV